MKRTLFQGLPTCTRYILSPQTLEPHLNLNGNNIPLTSLSPSTPFKLRLLSSKPDSFAATSSDPVAETDSTETQKEASSTDVDDVSSEELKRRIERYFEGDAEAIPSIFEAILKRKLAGKHDDSDDELMEKLGPKLANDVIDEEFDSEEDEL